jgi:hypothetical protein
MVQPRPEQGKAPFSSRFKEFFDARTTLMTFTYIVAQKSLCGLKNPSIPGEKFMYLR